VAVSGRISVLVSTELNTLLQAIRGFDAEQRAQIRAATKKAADPIWREEVRGNVTTRLQTRVLSDTARVAVSDSNVLLRSASAGKVGRSGTPASILAPQVEYGNDPNKKISTRSGQGKTYTRRMGRVSMLPRARGYVIGPAARESIPRFAALWIQTTIRTMHETLEKGGAK
jgi:hypothetical protein